MPKKTKIPHTTRILVQRKVLYVNYNVVAELKPLLVNCNMKYVCMKGKADELLLGLKTLVKHKPQWFSNSSQILLTSS